MTFSLVPSASRCLILRSTFKNLLSEDFQKAYFQSQHRKRKEEIISLSLEHSVISPYTSFVAVEEREKDEIVQKTVDIETLMSEIREDNLPYVAYSDVPRVQVT